MPLFLWALYAHGHHPGPGHARAGDHAAAAGRRAAASASASSIRRCGGDPILFQHFFWFYSHPAVYIMILPAMGIMSEVIAVFCRKHIFGYQFIAYSSVAIALIGFLVWGHHMFVSGQSPLVANDLQRLDLLRGHSLGDQGLQLAGHDVQGLDRAGHADVLRADVHLPVRHRRADRPVPRRAWPSNVHVHDTYFVVAHFHYVMVGGALIGFSGRAALLVAEDHRPDVQRTAGADSSPR